MLNVVWVVGAVCYHNFLVRPCPDHDASKPEVVFPKNWENNCFVNSYLFPWPELVEIQKNLLSDTIQSISVIFYKLGTSAKSKISGFSEDYPNFPEAKPKAFSLPVPQASNTSRWRACGGKLVDKKFS